MASGTIADRDNNIPGKRKKHRTNKSSYLTKWLDKTMNHSQVQDLTSSMDTYGSYINTNVNYNSPQPHHGYSSCSYNMYGYSAEPMSLPTLPTHYNPIYSACQNVTSQVRANNSAQVQRSIQQKRNSNKTEEVENMAIGVCDSKFSFPKIFSDTQDFASLPPLITSAGDTTSTSDMNTNDKENYENSRRYSDPCIQSLPDPGVRLNVEADSESEVTSDDSASQVGSRLLSCLVDQINSLRLANERLNRELQESKVELNIARQQNSIWQKTTSASATPNHSPLNGLVGGQYSPGFLTDLVREIRDAARIREEALYARVRSMVLERTDSGLGSSESKGNEKTLDEIKIALQASEADKRSMMERILRLEQEIRILKLSNSAERAETNANVINGNVEDSEAEKLRMRKELADTRMAKQNAEETVLKLERLVTQLRSKFNGLQLSPNGAESVSSDHEHETNSRTRRTSLNSNSNATVVFGPVTDL